MKTSDNDSTTQLHEVGRAAVERGLKWVEESKKYQTDFTAKLLAQTLKDPSGLNFTVAFVDEVVRPEDLRIAGKNLARLTKKAPRFLPFYLRYPAKLGGMFAPVLPELVVPIARGVFRLLVGDLVMDVSDKKLGTAIAKLRASGARLNMNLLGEAVLGDKEAQRRLDDTAALIKRDDVDYVSLKVSAVTGPHNAWSFDKIADHAVEQLLPLFQEAAAYSPTKFINLDMEEYHDLHLTIKVFKELLERPDLHHLEAGIVLQAYLPDALDAMKDLQEWAAKRVANGGARIKVRVVKGANLMMENVDAKMHGWELTTHDSKCDTDASYIKVLDYALTPERTKNVKIGIAGMNIFTAGFGYELAKARGVLENNGAEFEMLTGMASTMAKAVTEDVGPLLYYVPVVHPEEYDVAIAYLVRRLEENAAEENFMSAVFDLTTSEKMLNRERTRFEKALDRVATVPTAPKRLQNRLNEKPEELTSAMKDENGQWTFKNTADSDPALPVNLQWANAIAARMKDSTLGKDIIDKALIKDEKELRKTIETAVNAGSQWASLPASERAEIIHRAGVIMAQRRADLIEVAGSEAGKALDQGDVEVSEAVDFAHYYAQRALELESIPGAKYVPSKLTVVTPPWNFPLAIPAGSTMSALVSGSPVILKPAGASKRCGAVLAQCFWDAGVPKDVLQLVQLANHDLGQQLVSAPEVERVILVGSIDTARRFRSWRNELNLLAETSGKNSIIVTPSADLDLAVKDIVQSAFGHAGQKCSAASLAILVGTVGTSKRFHNQLLDAVRSLNVGYPWDLSTQMGPLCEPAKGKLLRGLTKVERGQTWAVKPTQLDDTGKLWSPGVRAGVEPGSEYHMTEYFGPILGIMRCDTLEEALELQNAVEYGLTAGIHTLNPNEIQYWIDNVQAGNCYVNRGITGAIVQRQPFGGWKRSMVGAGTKAGGPSYLFGLGDFKRDTLVAVQDQQNQGEPISRLSSNVLQTAQDLKLSTAEMELLTTSMILDEQAWDQTYSKLHDPSDLGVERNVLRYLPVPVTVRVGKNAPWWEVLRVVAAGLAVHSRITLSCASSLPEPLFEFCCDENVVVEIAEESDWHVQAATWAQSETDYDARIRLIGEDKSALAKAIEGSVDVAIWDHEVTLSGRVEMLPFVREQAIALTNHRFGDPTPITESLLQENLT